MSQSTQLSEELKRHPNLANILKFFEENKSYIDRLNRMFFLRSKCFVGLSEMHLEKKWIMRLKNKKSLPNAPNKVMIRKDCISDLSYLTQKSRRTIERGVSAFFKKNFHLTNCSFYSRDWLIFKIPSKKDKKVFKARSKRTKSRKLFKDKLINLNFSHRAATRNIRRSASNEKETGTGTVKEASTLKGSACEDTTTQKKEILSTQEDNVTSNGNGKCNVINNHNDKDNGTGIEGYFGSGNDHGTGSEGCIYSGSGNGNGNGNGNEDGKESGFVNFTFSNKNETIRKRQLNPICFSDSKRNNNNNTIQNLHKKQKTNQPNFRFNQNQNECTPNWKYGTLKIDLYPSFSFQQNNWLQELESEFGLKC
eukprot:Anaeramoba_flamelloidesc38698_g1_i1.p1 GENE.c38698_g1_i1~~c38698_g1_i1.p1  ORF type:complete len:365 (+),score=83.61 c38698_g1_i1:70-1164(+)